ncbi:MAG: glycosyltransferase [Pseudomonadota bacterium]
MKRFYDFNLSSDALSGVRFVVYRDGLSSNGDIESGILQGVARLKRHDPAKRVGDVLDLVLKDPGIDVIVLIRNPSVVLDQSLSGRIANTLALLPPNDQWSIVCAGGLGASDRRHLAIYASETPAIPDCSGPQPVLDAMPDIYLINADFARLVLANCHTMPETALEPILVTEGYLQGRCAMFTPCLTVGIDGTLMARDIHALTRELSDHFGHVLADQSIETLAGPIKIPTGTKLGENAQDGSRRHGKKTLADEIDQTLRRHSGPLTLSVVVRTRFDRNHLLDRLLASLSRNDRGSVELEVLLSTDADPALAQENLTRLQMEFCNLQIRLQQNHPGAHSRVTNMVCGLRAARHDYLMLIDDDDYVDLFALNALSGANFLGNMPLIVTDSQVHDETWEKTPSGRWVLTQSTWRKTYHASGWRDLFSGANQLPVCALIMPKNRLRERLDTFCFSHDLSEDYALFLLIFTDPQLPAIFEIDGTFCHISLRGLENSVTMSDRRPWVSDITGYLSDLTTNPGVAGPGLWALLTAARTTSDDISRAQSTADLQSALHRSEANATLLRQENERLRNQLKSTSEIA